jgi:hypothetical protein
MSVFRDDGQWQTYQGLCRTQGVERVFPFVVVIDHEYIVVLHVSDPRESNPFDGDVCQEIARVPLADDRTGLDTMARAVRDLGMSQPVLPNVTVADGPAQTLPTHDGWHTPGPGNTAPFEPADYPLRKLWIDLVLSLARDDAIWGSRGTSTLALLSRSPYVQALINKIEYRRILQCHEASALFSDDKDNIGANAVRLSVVADARLLWVESLCSSVRQAAASAFDHQGPDPWFLDREAEVVAVENPQVFRTAREHLCGALEGGVDGGSLQHSLSEADETIARWHLARADMDRGAQMAWIVSRTRQRTDRRRLAVLVRYMPLVLGYGPLLLAAAFICHAGLGALAGDGSQSARTPHAMSTWASIHATASLLLTHCRLDGVVARAGLAAILAVACVIVLALLRHRIAATWKSILHWAHKQLGQKRDYAEAHLVSGAVLIWFIDILILLILAWTGGLETVRGQDLLNKLVGLLALCALIGPFALLFLAPTPAGEIIIRYGLTRIVTAIVGGWIFVWAAGRDLESALDLDVWRLAILTVPLLVMSLVLATVDIQRSATGVSNARKRAGLLVAMGLAFSLTLGVTSTALTPARTHAGARAAMPGTSQADRTAACEAPARPPAMEAKSAIPISIAAPKIETHSENGWRCRIRSEYEFVLLGRVGRVRPGLLFAQSVVVLFLAVVVQIVFEGRRPLEVH